MDFSFWLNHKKVDIFLKNNKNLVLCIHTPSGTYSTQGHNLENDDFYIMRNNIPIFPQIHKSIFQSTTLIIGQIGPQFMVNPSEKKLNFKNS